MTTTDFVMPKLGLTMTEGTIARWDVAPGKSFAQGDIILVVEPMCGCARRLSGDGRC